MPRCNTRDRNLRLVSRSLLTFLMLLCGAVLIEMTGLVAVARASSPATSHVCSRDDRGQIWPSEVRTGSRDTLVPAGADSLVICGYNGSKATSTTPQFALTGIDVSDSSTEITKLTRELDAIKPIRNTAMFSCPSDVGSQDIMIFGYAAGPGAVVTLDTGGCGALSNHRIQRLALGAPVVGQIGGLLKPVKLTWATVVGHITLCGGPAPSGCHVVNFNGADTVVAADANGHTVASVQAHKGRFRFLVASPGAYEFALRTSIHNLTRVTSQVKAKLRAGHTTLVVFHVAIP